MTAEKVISITNGNFECEVLQSDKPVMVDFWATWCGPCRAVAPIVEELADEYDRRIKVGKVNVDEENNLAMRYKVMSIPTLLFFKDGQVVNRVIGARAKKDLAKILDNNL